MCRLYSWLENAKLRLYITNEDNFTNVVELPQRERETLAARGARTVGLWKARIAAAAAAIALTAVLGFAVKTAWLDHTLQTQASEWRSVPLSDGSSITAGPYTKLRHAIGDDQRRITLTQGKAMFRVAEDSSRPFLVDAGEVEIKATGTQFTVERQGDAVSVTMRVGTVVVSPSADSAATFASVSLVEDEQLTISGSAEPAVTAVNGEVSSEWARGLVVFEPGDTIKDAVAEFNGYNAIKIAVDDATGARPVRGSFDAIDPLSFAAVVERSTGSPVVRESSKLVRIGPAESRSR
jgi:transmembrane sensor